MIDVRHPANGVPVHFEIIDAVVRTLLLRRDPRSHGTWLRQPTLRP